MSFRSQDIKSLIDIHGRALTFTSKASPIYNPATGNVSTTDSTYTVNGYFYNYNLQELNNMNIVLGDRKLALPTVDTSGVEIPEPSPDDTFSGQGDLVRVVSVSKILSGVSVMCYICQVRE